MTELEHSPQRDETIEVQDTGPDVAPSKKGKIVFILAVAILASIVVYIFFFRKSPEEIAQEKQDVSEIIVEDTGRRPVKERDISYDLEDVIPEIPEEEDFVEEPEKLEIPELPELSQDINKELEKELKQEILDAQKIEDKEVFTKEEVSKLIEEKIKSLQDQKQITPSLTGTGKEVTDQQRDSSLVIPLGEKDKKSKEKDLELIKKSRVLAERKGAPMFKIKGSAGKQHKEAARDSIIILDKDLVMDIKDSKPDVIPTKVPDLSRVVLQGKVINAVLESSINTDVQAPVRALVSRDVYAEFGKNILIPKGSRLIGSYQKTIKRGQSRITIIWNRIIRVDGLSLNISASAVDNLGRGGVEGDVDNKYAEILGNVFLSSVLSIATAIAVEEVTNTTGISNTTNNSSSDTTTTSGKPSDYAVVDATKDLMDRTKELVDEISEQQPTARIPQGTRIIVMVNQDLSLPLFKQEK